MSESLPDIAALRAQAKCLRAQADEIDQRIDEFVAWFKALSAPVIAPPSFIKPVQQSAAVTASSLLSASPDSDRKRIHRGKPFGAISMVWRRHYLAARLFDGEVFPLSAVINQINRHDGRPPRATALRRHLKNHIEHGYLELVGQDTYRMTQKLLDMLDKLPGNEGSVIRPSETSSPQQESGDVPPPALDDDMIG